MKVILVSLSFIGLAWATSDLSCECGWRNGGRIMGGINTMLNEYPWMVALRTKASRFTFCGGSILTEWHVITAASCIVDHTTEDLMLIVGAYDVYSLSEGTSQLHFVDDIIKHPGFDEVKNINDLAILVTKKQIDIDTYVGPICLPNEPIGKKLIDNVVKAMGWGRYNPKTQDIDKIKKLKEIDHRIVKNKICENSDGARLCTFPSGRDTCLGDSGGPLAWLDPDTNRFTLVGVVSTAPPKCDYKKLPAINTDVSAYLKWIQDTIAHTKQPKQTCSKI